MLNRRSFLRFIPAALALPFVARAECAEARTPTVLHDVPRDPIYLTPAKYPGVLHAMDGSQPWSRTVLSNTSETITFNRPFGIAGSDIKAGDWIGVDSPGWFVPATIGKKVDRL